MSSDWNPGIEFAHLTDVGMRRANNQDALACLPAKTPERYQSHGHLLVVADGMGAHAAGELASQMAVERIAMQYFRATESSQAESIRQALMSANEAIHARGQSNPEFHNMGTTGSALVLAPEGAVIGHVGDSRVYRLRDGVLEQLTFDHSLVWEMEASGNSSQHFPKNVITRSLGPSPQVEVDIEGPIPIRPGDCYLVCSDGLTGLVEDSELGPLMECLPEDKLVRVLVDLANLRGGPDNISVIVARVKMVSEPATASVPTPKSKKNRSSSALTITTGACIAAAALLGAIGMMGPMVIAIILGVIAAIVTLFQWTGPWMTNPNHHGSGAGAIGGTSGPYRRYDAKPTADLYTQLGDTVAGLRKAAELNNWMMDWNKVESLQTRGVEALGQKEIRDAIRLQAEAVIETMKQLREQNDQSASETAIEH